MAIEVQVFNRLNRAIGEIRPGLREVTWRLNDYGRVVLQLPANDSKATAEYLQFGNRLLVQFDNGLPPFGGVIDIPRTWQNGLVEITAYSGEYLLGFRITGRGRYFDEASVGNIARALLEDANGVRPTGLDVGEFWDGGNRHWPEFHYKNLYTIFNQSLFGKLSSADYAVLPTLQNGELVFTLNVYERRGSDKPGIGLHEGFNVVPSSKLVEQGPIYNSTTTVGDGEGWGEDRPVATAVDQDSISIYGLREYSYISMGTINSVTLQDQADTELAANKAPHNLYTVSATNKPPGTFAQYDVGDSVSLEMPTYGFGGTRGLVRILGRTYQPDMGLCDLITQGVDSAETN